MIFIFKYILNFVTLTFILNISIKLNTTKIDKLRKRDKTHQLILLHIQIWKPRHILIGEVVYHLVESIVIILRNWSFWMRSDYLE